MDKGTITLIASGIAATSSVAVLLLRSRSDRLSEYRQANRERLDLVLEDIGDAVYQVVSSTILSEVDGKNKNHYNRVKSNNIRKLSKLRVKVRYPLWGIDEGFKVLILLPGFIKNKNKKDKKIIFDLCTKLRIVLDKTIKNCHQYGRPPTYIDRIKVTYLAWKINKILGEIGALHDDELNHNIKNYVKYPKIKARIINREDKVFIAKDNENNDYIVSVNNKSGKGSRSLVQAGMDVNLYKREGENFYRYRIISPGSYNKRVKNDAQ